MFGKGISKEGDVLDLATRRISLIRAEHGIYNNDNKIGQGRENAKQYLAENPEVFAEVYDKLREKYIKESSRYSEGINE